MKPKNQTPGPWWIRHNGIWASGFVYEYVLSAREHEGVLFAGLGNKAYEYMVKHEFPLGTSLDTVMLKAEELLIAYLKAVEERFGQNK